MKLIEKEYQEPSEEFCRAFVTSGSPAVDCELCGRLHFDQNGEFMDEGELDRYVAKQKEKPEKYFAQDCGISWGHIDGKQFVWGCPCNKARAFEDFIWRHRRQIAAYLKAVTKRRLASAQLDADSVAEIP